VGIFVSDLTRNEYFPGQGKGTREIAQEMNVAIPTISSFKNRIKEKLRFKNSTEMILYALQWFRKELSEGGH